jgi:SMC interacting uncharacterized protein involved in chromosome segregation
MSFDFEKEHETFRKMIVAMDAMKEAMESAMGTISRMRMQTERAFERIENLEDHIGRLNNALADSGLTQEVVNAIDSRIESAFCDHNDAQDHFRKWEIKDMIDNKIEDLDLEDAVRDVLASCKFDVTIR